MPRIFVTKEWHIPAEVVAPRRNRNGSGLVRRMTESARKKGAQILLKHRMTRIIREQPMSGRVLGIEVKTPERTINIRATKGVIIATGGHTGNVNFRRMFDPRLTEEYQQACQPYVDQDAVGRACRDGHRRVAVGDRDPDHRDRRRDHQDAPHRLPLGLLVAGLRDRQRRCSRRPRPPASP